MRVEVFHKYKEDKSEFPLDVWMWSMRVSLSRPEMGLKGSTRFLEVFCEDRFEYYIFDGEKPIGAIFMGIDCEDVHFGKVPMMLGMFCDNRQAAKTLYKACIADLKSHGYNRIVRTKRINESEYRTFLVDI